MTTSAVAVHCSDVRKFHFLMYLRWVDVVLTRGKVDLYLQRRKVMREGILFDGAED